MSSGASAVEFLAATGLALAAGGVLVRRLESIAGRFGASEALLGLVAALAADGPEITAAGTALARGQHGVGAGVVLGSNAFNLAALLGLTALLAGRVALRRREVLLGGGVGLGVAVLALLTAAGTLPAGAALPPAALLLLLSAWIVAVPAAATRRLPLPPAARGWLRAAVAEEEADLVGSRHPAHRRSDGPVAAAALVAVIALSIVMEHAASDLGASLKLSQAVVGGLLLAAVTSLPNAVAAVYLARRGRGAATFSTAMNSNAVNVVLGLLAPAAAVGLGRVSGSGLTIAAWYTGLTAVAVGLAAWHRGLGRRSGALLVAGYLALVVLVVLG